ncbi:thiol-disulfide oxidoreductase DCC family protein [Ancylobacter terrae]|uniref:thiol-disulfide oxidoreductase DCC family protein n=1 Tax=Ancylobacter sp. sgz301288 TaxID=3342077 RepID=UPI00385F341C
MNKVAAMTKGSAVTGVTVWYDSACPLCRREIALMQRLDRRGRIAFVDIHAARPVNPVALLARLLAREDGELRSGAAACAAMWRQISLLRPLGLAGRNPVVLAVLERAYLAFLRLRPRLQSLARRFEGRRG